MSDTELPIALRVEALESLLIEKGYVDPATLDKIIDTYENEVGPQLGAAVVAKAWVDPAYRARLLADATKAAAEVGAEGRQGEHLVAVGKRDTEHGARKDLGHSPGEGDRLFFRSHRSP